jgi:hypothetical protein
MRLADPNASRAAQTVTNGLAALALSVSACLCGSPQTQVEGLCASTQSGNGCLSLFYYPTDSVRSGAACLRGTLNWSLYRGGDVGLFGPGNNPSLYGGAFEADFTNCPGNPLADAGLFDESKLNDAGANAEGLQGEVDLPDIPAQSYQALGYLDCHGTGESSSGDPVTMPQNAFKLLPDTYLQVSVALDHVM